MYGPASSPMHPPAVTSRAPRTRGQVQQDSVTATAILQQTQALARAYRAAMQEISTKLMQYDAQLSGK